MLPALLFSTTLKDLVKNYKQGHYKKVCKEGYRLFDKLRKDENLVSMYAFSCLKSDYIDRLAVPMLILGKSPQSRRNRSYFSLILTQKNILISALADGETFERLHVPNTDHVISKVFNIYFQKKYKKVDNEYRAEDKDGKYRFFIQKSKKGTPFLVIIEEREGKITKHIYR